MRIGIDARELVGQATGIGRYVAHLCREWSRAPIAEEHRFVLYVPDTASPSSRSFPFLGVADRFDVTVVPGGAGTRWEQAALPPIANADQLDVFFAPAYSAPLRLRPPCVLTIPDVSFAAHPEWFTWREGVRRRWLATRAAARAVRVLTISEFSRREISNHLGVQIDRIQVTPLAVEDPRCAVTSRPPREPLVLFVGSIFTRRHLPVLIAAFARARRRVPAARLAIIGSNRTYPGEDLRATATDEGVGEQVTIEDWVEEDRLTAWYARAGAFAFLSEYEGFGLPPLEAIAAGIPSVVLDTPVAREVYGNAVTYVTLHDVDGIADALVQALQAAPAPEEPDPAVREVLARYSWSSTASRTLAELTRAARSGRP